MKRPRWLLVLLGLTMLTLVVFALWPGVDLAVAHFFYDHGGFAGRDGLERFGREFFRVTPFVAAGRLRDSLRLAPARRRGPLCADRPRA